MDSGYAATGSEREMFDTNCLLGQRLFFARLDRIVWAEKCFYKMPNVLVLVVKKKKSHDSILLWPKGPTH